MINPLFYLQAELPVGGLWNLCFVGDLEGAQMVHTASLTGNRLTNFIPDLSGPTSVYFIQQLWGRAGEHLSLVSRLMQPAVNSIFSADDVSK